MHKKFTAHLAQQLEDIRIAGTFKAERVITTPQDVHIEVAGSDVSGRSPCQK